MSTTHDKTAGLPDHQKAKAHRVKMGVPPRGHRGKPRPLTTVLSQHLYVCDQETDPCYEIAPATGETWHDFAERKAAHLADVLDQDGAQA